MTRGAIVRRKADPVHSGCVTALFYSAGRTYVSVRWLAGNVAEHRIPAAELELAEDWKEPAISLAPLFGRLK